MTKGKKDLSPQMSLFDWIKRAEELSRQLDNPAKGSLDIDTELRAAVSEDLKHAEDQTGRELSRHEVAARMSDLVGQEITIDANGIEQVVGQKIIKRIAYKWNKTLGKLEKLTPAQINMPIKKPQ